MIREIGFAPLSQILASEEIIVETTLSDLFLNHALLYKENAVHLKVNFLELSLSGVMFASKNIKWG